MYVLWAGIETQNCFCSFCNMMFVRLHNVVGEQCLLVSLGKADALLVPHPWILSLNRSCIMAPYHE